MTGGTGPVKAPTTGGGKLTRDIQNTIDKTDLTDTLNSLSKEKDKKITVLVSDLVEKTTLQSTPVPTEVPGETPAEIWEQYYSANKYYSNFIEEVGAETPAPAPTPAIWEQEYSINKYYDKYLPEPAVETVPNLESFVSTRLLAEVMTDVGNGDAEEELNPFIDAETNPSSPYFIDNGDKIVADGKTLIKVSAQIYDSNGRIDSSTGRRIKFSISESDIPNMVTFVNGPIVNSDRGIATVYLRAGTKTGPGEGRFKIKAESLDGEFPFSEKDLYLFAGDPYSLEITSDSGILVANNQSKTQLHFTIKDKFGNICTNDFSQIGVFAKTDKAYLDENADNNANILGTQVATISGVGNVDLYAKDSTGDVKVIALLFDPELEKAFIDAGDDWKSIDFSKYIGSSKTLTVVDRVGLRLSLTANSIALNRSTNLRSELLYRGNVVSSYNGPIKFTNLNENVINFANQMPQNMTNGYLHEANMKLDSSTLSGEAEILVDVPGFVSDSVKVNVLPGAAKKIELSSDVADYIYTNGDSVVLKATLLDRYGNVVDTDNSTPVRFGITAATEGLIDFTGAMTAIALKGVASTTIRGGDISGEAHLFAKDQAERLTAGTLSVGVVSHVNKFEAGTFSPRALYMSVLGGAFGNPILKDNLAQIFLYDSRARAQAVTSVTSTADDNKRLLSIDSYGKITSMTEGLEMKSVFATASFPYQKIVVSDTVSNKELAAIFLAPKNGLDLNLLTGDETMTAEGIYVKQLSLDEPSLTLTEKTDGVYIERNGETEAKIDTFGRISLLNDTYEIRPPDEESDGIKVSDFSFVITSNQNPVALVTYKQNTGDVKTLPYYSTATSFYPGIYVQLKSPSNQYNLIPSFSGSSTANSKGIYLIDTTAPIDATQAPGFPQTSLDKAGTTAGIGFEGQNKYMLFFAAGNSVGESNIPYASEVGITYGDPTVRLEIDGVMGLVSRFSGYAKTIGKPIFAGDEPITTMMDFDFNGDGYDDTLLLYESGLVRLLENENSNKRFNDRGFILNIPGGAFSATKIDVNNDGYDDLIVGTKESCREGEECMSLFKNIYGHFERQTLNLALDGKAYEMKVGDANADGCDDLFVSDSSGNIRLFYNRNTGSTCGGLETNYSFSRNFGFAVSNTQNTAKSLFVYYSAVDRMFQHDVLDKQREAERVDISTSEGMQEKADLEKEIQKNKSKYLKFTLQSTQPPGAIKNDDDPNFNVETNTDPNFDPAKYAEDAAAFQQMAQSNTQVHDRSIPTQTFPREYNFIHVPENTDLSSSTKFALDINGQFANVDDEIQYDVTLRNNSGSAISNLMLSDGTPAAIEIMMDSLRCMDAGCSDNLTATSWVETGVQLRSYIIKGISIPAHGSRRIQYKFKLVSVPKVHFNVGKDLGEYPAHRNDAYLDILVRPEFRTNTNIAMTHFYSTGINSSGKVVYQRMDTAPATDRSDLMADKFAGNGLPLNSLLDIAANPPPQSAPPRPALYLGSRAKWEASWWEDNRPEIDPELQESLAKQLQNLTVDSNFNGIPNSWDGVSDNVPGEGLNLPGTPSAPPGSGSGTGTSSSESPGFSNPLSELNEMADNIANGVENGLSALRCSGAGCLPIPYNYAFMVPDMAVPGIATFAWGIPWIVAMAFWPSSASSTGRFYLSPTLDGGLGTALCIGYGPGHTSPCWAFAAPMSGLGVCPDFQGAASDAIASAKEAVNSATGGAVAITSDGVDPSQAGAASDSETISGSSAYSDPESPLQAGASANIRIPGFPTVITDWLDKEIQEIHNKLLDLPDIYFVYPDFASLGPEFSNAASNFSRNRGGWNSVHDFLKAINSFPFVTIEGREIVIRIPTIPSNQIEKYKIQWNEWLIYERAQLERLEVWECDQDANSYCQIFKTDFADFIHGVESMLDTLDRIGNLPYEILKWKNWEAKYATEIICYLDAIMVMLGGYIKKQLKIVGAWMQMIEEIIRIFEGWKMILDVITEYQTSCDECKNDRFSRLGLLLQLFIAIPSPPIIPLPKLPDLVFDFSQVQLGTKIIWPDIVFKPQPIYLPDLPLPLITIPIIPDINIEFPGWVFDFTLPQLPDLPDLPPLPIPKLPDLPRPPKIPALPDVVVSLLANLKPMFRILCLLKKGRISVMESQLETQIETLTQPNVDVVLGIISSLAVQLPAITYDYVKEIRVTVQSQFEMNLEPIYNAAKLIADRWNIFIKNSVGKINQATQYPFAQIVEEAIIRMMETAGEALGAAIISTFSNPDGTGTPVDVKNLTPEQKQQLEQALGEEEFNALMRTLENTTPAPEPATPETPTEPATPRVPTVTAPATPTDPGQTLPPEDSDAIRETSNVLLSYLPALKIKENAEKFTKTIEDFVKNMPKDDSPSVYYLTATQTYLDKDDPLLNRPLAQIKNDISKQDLPNTPEMQRLVNLRSSLISYAENLEKSNSDLSQNVGDIENFTKILAENDQSLDRISELSKSPLFDPDNNSYIASNTTSDSLGDSSTKIPFFGKEISDQLQTAAGNTDTRLLALNPQITAATTGSSSTTASGPVPAPKGLFVIIDGRNENILNYTAELGGKTNMIFTDVDHDGDEDLVYSMGGDVYLKENYTNQPNLRSGSILSLYGHNSLHDYVNEAGDAVQGVSAPSDNNQSAEITWQPSSNPNIVSYEIILRNSIYDDIDDSSYSYTVDNDKTSLSVEVANGNYYATVFALDADSNRSLESTFAITAPQDCADKEAPFPAIDTSYEIPVMKEFELDAGNSFDTNGEIVEYYIETLPYTNGTKRVTAIPATLWSDMNVIFDSNRDGVLWNDKNNPKFKIGPFVNEGDVGVHEFVLHVVDQSGNSSSQHFTLNVFVPNISLDDTLSRDPVASGKTDPSIPKMPFSLMRKRLIYRVSEGQLQLVSRLKKVETESISPNQKYYTDDSGAYSVSDLTTKDIITVEDKTGVVVAEIDPSTGDIGIIKPGYSTRANEAVPPITPTSVDIIDAAGDVLGSVYVIADPNIDVTLHQNYGFEASNFASLSGVHIDDINVGDDFVMKKFPANDRYYPGGAALVYLRENKYPAFVDTSGNILIADPRVTLTQKANNHETDPLIFELRFENTPVAEIYISSLGYGQSGLIVGPNDVPYTTPRSPSNENLYGEAFKKGEPLFDSTAAFIGPAATIANSSNDNPDDLSSMLEDLYKRWIINDLLSNENFKLDFNTAVTRAEFVNILLNMLCIIPRKPDAYKTYKSGEGFSDMRYPDGNIPWFFPYIREASMPDRQLVDGYTGATDIDPQTGLSPFRPDNNISRAEATKIIIDALVMKGVIDGSKIVKDAGRPWYEPYITASLDLTTYLKPDVPVKNIFILTATEAADPNKKMIFKDLLTMTLRVIDLYDCYSIDADGDGMSDFYESKNGVSDPNADPDGDGLTNLEESLFGSNPNIADSDHGGATDGQEKQWGTNPLNPLDDPFDNDNDGLTNMTEKLVYRTDPNNPDTDADCVNDGQEATNLTDPLNPGTFSNCDGNLDDFKEGLRGLYIVPAECDTCPCISTFDHKADIVPTDIFFSVISNFDESYFFSKSNEVTAETVTTE
ncbi:MAG: FG-GAP-like repeat-containing protein [Candidatus Gracilibacteria bacterium]|jgi:uncharacterized repeat protein (TIGR01451 family)